MYINEITYVLYDLIDEFYKKRNNQLKKILIFDNRYFYVTFVVDQKTDYFEEQLDGSTENLINFIIENHIKKIIANNIKTSDINITYNFSDEITHKVMIIFTEFIKDNEIIYPNEQQEKDALSLKEKTLNKQKKYETYQLKAKIYKAIYDEGGEISLSKIIQKTRGIKNPEKRKAILQELIDEKAIALKIDKSNKRKKNIYKII